MDDISAKLHTAITEVLEEAFESMAFISTEECSKEDAAAIQQEMMAVNLLITEPVLFEMRLDVAKELLYQVAETMYTMDRDELEDKFINDLLAELLNTLAGRFMTEILPDEKSFSLSLPELATDESNAPALKFYYSAEECPISIEINSADMDTLFATLQ